jgi:hypothetical protein
MSNYDERVGAFAKYGMDAIDRLVRDHAELFLTVDQKDAVEKIVAVTRLRSDIPAPTSADEAYDQLMTILGELLRDSKLKAADYGLSVLGRNQYQDLVRRASGEVLPQPDPYAEVVRLYKTNVSEFNDRRASDPDFLQRSNAAQAAGLLR